MGNQNPALFIPSRDGESYLYRLLSKLGGVLTGNLIPMLEKIKSLSILPQFFSHLGRVCLSMRVVGVDLYPLGPSQPFGFQFLGFPGVFLDQVVRLAPVLGQVV